MTPFPIPAPHQLPPMQPPLQQAQSQASALRPFRHWTEMAWRGSLSKTLQELRVHLDQGALASQGVKDFLAANYSELKKANPSFPILVREAAGVEAKLIARYDFGVEKAVSVQGDSPAAISSKLQELIKAGEGLPRSNE